VSASTHEQSRRPVVLLTVPVDVPAVDGYDVVPGDLGDRPDAVGLLCGPMQRLTAADLDALPGLRAVSVAGAGTDGLDLDALGERGIPLSTAPEPTAPATADLAVTLMLMAARRLDESQALLRDGSWPGWSFDDVPGRDLHGATLGLVGFGHIGRLVARRAEAFGMTCLHHTRTPTGEPGHVADLADMLPRSDVLSVHVPLTTKTRGLIGPVELDLMPRDAIVVNTARGGIVDEQALCDRLDDGRLFAAGLDVFEDEPRVHPRLLRTPHLVLTPHIGSATRQTRERMVVTAAQRLAALLSP